MAVVSSSSSSLDSPQDGLRDEGSGKFDFQEDSPRGRERKQSHNGRVKSKLWAVTGTRRVNLLNHKDGTQHPVDCEVRQFSTAENTRFAVHVRRVSGEQPSAISRGALDSQGSEIGDYTVGRTLGKGAYGLVREGKHKVTGERVAIKTLQRDCMDRDEEERTLREIEIMAQLNHPNITKLYSVIHTPGRIHIVMEYSGGGELLDYVKTKDGLSEDESRRLLKQLVSALQYCHKHNVVHRDIKHKNILLTDDLDLKLIDFGVSNFIKSGELRSTFCGTPAYAAPEMILSQRYSGPEVDIWSIGVVLFALRAKRFPFGNVLDIINCNYSSPDDFSPELKDLLAKIFTKKESRITMEQLLLHPWVQNAESSADAG